MPKNSNDRYRVTHDLLEDTRRLISLIDNPLAGGVPNHDHNLSKTIRIAITSVDKRLLGALGMLIIVLGSVGASIFLVSSNRSDSTKSTKDPLPSRTESTVESLPAQPNEEGVHNSSITIDVVGGKA